MVVVVWAIVCLACLSAGQLVLGALGLLWLAGCIANGTATPPVRALAGRGRARELAQDKRTAAP